MGDYNLSVTLSLKCDAIDQIGGQGSNQLANRNIKHLTRMSGWPMGTSIIIDVKGILRFSYFHGAL